MTGTETTTVHQSTVVVAVAALRMYQAEVALHDAHGTSVDAWIAAAADRLHEAIETYLEAVAFARC